jgi:hypothetical protein
MDRIRRFISDWLSVTLALGVGVSTIIKLSGLRSRELWLDESRSAFFANLPFHDLLRYSLGDTAPPLYHALLWVWVRVVGSALPELRLLSVLLSVLGAFGMFILARAWLGTRTAGTFAALLFAFSPMLFVYSLEVRQYMLLLCCIIGALIIHHRVVVESRTTKSSVLLYCLLATLLFYSHYIGLFVLAGLLLDWLIATELKGVGLRSWCFVVLLVSFAAAPWIPTMIRQRGLTLGVYHAQAAGVSDPTSLSFGSPTLQPALGEKVVTIARALAATVGFFPARTGVLLILLAVPFVAVLLGIPPLIIAGDRTCRTVAFVLLMTFVGLFGLKMIATRYFLPLLPPLILAMTSVVQSCLQSKHWRKAGIVVGSFLFLISFAGFIRQSSVRYANPWHGLISALRPAYTQGDVLVFDVLYGQVPFDFAAKDVRFNAHEDGFPETVYRWWEQQPVKIWGGPVLRESDLESTIKRVLEASTTPTVWLVLYEVNYYDPHDRLLARFSELGDAKEFFRELPQKADDPSADKGLRLVRISLRK